MNLLDEQTQPTGGIVNYFQGATINNLVINGNMSRSGTEYYGAEAQRTHTARKATTEEVVSAVTACTGFMWGPAAMAVIFGACRDIYDWTDNASQFERTMRMRNIYCPEGTVSNTFRHNPYMRSHVDTWAQLGASRRVLRLLSAFEQEVEGGGDTKTTE